LRLRQVIAWYWDWLKAYHDELVVLFQPKDRLPSYSTDGHFCARITGIFGSFISFFDIQPLPGETIATDGALRGSYEATATTQA